MEKTTPLQELVPSVWQVGDLCQFPSGLVLCVGATDAFAYFITADGMPLADIQLLDESKQTYFLQNTGLTYPYQSRQQLLRDYINGFFNPYFNLL